MKKLLLTWGTYLLLTFQTLGQITGYEKIWLPENFVESLLLRKEYDISKFDEFPIKAIVMRGDDIFFDTHRGRFAKAIIVKDSIGRIKITNLNKNINMSHYQISEFNNVDFFLLFSEESIQIEKSVKGKPTDTLRYVLVNKQMSNITYLTAEGYLLLNGSFELSNPLRPYFRGFEIEFKLDGTVVSPIWKAYTIIRKGNMIENIKYPVITSCLVELIDPQGVKTQKMLIIHNPSEFRFYDFTKNDRNVYRLDDKSFSTLKVVKDSIWSRKIPSVKLIK
ncbi:hypothetical protein [Sphingobacterium pedocola]|nr:hypothetical protein [Sphingobacterium pedocola]